MTGQYSGTARLWIGELSPVYVTWAAESGGSVTVLGGGTVQLARLDGTAYVQGTASHTSGAVGTAELWYNLNLGTAFGGASVPRGDYDLVFTWPGSASGEAFTRTHSRRVLLTVY